MTVVFLVWQGPWGFDRDWKFRSRSNVFDRWALWAFCKSPIEGALNGLRRALRLRPFKAPSETPSDIPSETLSGPGFCSRKFQSEEDKRATTNVQNGLVFFFLFSLILFPYLWTKTAVKPLNSKKKSWRINSEKLWKSVKMCGTLPKSAKKCPLVVAL